MGRYPKHRLPATIYMVEVEGHPVVLFKAVSYLEARELVRELWFRSDLKRKRNGSSAVWDGKARLSVRVASATEAASVALALANDSKQTDSVALVYLNA
jgi:hypothetical protein